MRKINTKFKDLFIIKSKVFFDNRGFFRETFKNKPIKKNLVFGCSSKSRKNVLRGLHLQNRKSQGKFITVLKGEIFDVAVDLRKNSKTFGKVFKIILSQRNALGLFIPGGFAHAYYSYEKENVIYYKLDNYYSPRFESGIFYNDKEIRVKWPRKKMLISKKDRKLKSFEEFKRKFKSL